MTQRLCAILWLAALGPSATTLAQSTLAWTPEVAVNANGEGYYRPRIVLNAAAHPVILWHDLSPPMNHLSVSDGITFGAPIMVHPMGFVPAGAEWMGTDLHASGNTIWAAMKGTPEDIMGMYLVRSDDGGYTWGDTLRIDQPGAWSRFPSVGSNALDEPVIQYMQFDSNFLDPRHVVVRAVAGVLQPPVQVSTPFANGEACDCCAAQVVTGANNVVALYRNNDANQRVIYGASSTDGGATFPDGNMLDGTDWMINACPSSGPDGYIAGDSVRYVWMSAASGSQRVYAGSADVGGLDTVPFRAVHPLTQTNLQQNFPRIAGQGDTLGVVWQQNHAGQLNILFAHSTTGLNGLSIPDTVNTGTLGQGRVPDIAYRDGTFHFAWTHLQGGVVRYRTATINNDVAVNATLPVIALECWPNPVRDVLHVEGSHWTTAVVVDVRGKAIAQLPTAGGEIDISGIAPGTYALHLSGKLGEKGMVRIEKL